MPRSRLEPVAIVTGGSCRSGQELARGLARWDWRIVVVYLEHQRTVEATVVGILATGGTIVAVRADVADDLDVERLFGEARAVFGGVDVVAHTTTQSAAQLFTHAARQVRWGGVIVAVPAAEGVPADVARELRECGISVSRAPPEEMLALLDEWRRL